MNLNAPSQVAALLARHGLHPKKGLGQHFLIDRNTLDRIAAAGDLSPEDCVLEIGAGLGVLTRALAARAARVLALELDPAMLGILAETVGHLPNVQVRQADVLRADLSALLSELLTAPSEWLQSGSAEQTGDGIPANPPVLPPSASPPLTLLPQRPTPNAQPPHRAKVIANLPYYVTSPAIAVLLEQWQRLERIVVLVQKEVALRLAARPCTSDYSSLSVLAQFYARVELVGTVPRTVFLPPPKVDSAIVRLRLRETPAVEVASPAVFFRVVRAAFGQRRKTLLNAMAGDSRLGIARATAAAALAAAGIDPARRGETLALPEFARLSDAVGSLADEAAVGRDADVEPVE